MKTLICFFFSSFIKKYAWMNMTKYYCFYFFIFKLLYSFVAMDKEYVAINIKRFHSTLEGVVYCIVVAFKKNYIFTRQIISKKLNYFYELIFLFSIKTKHVFNISYKDYFSKLAFLLFYFFENFLNVINNILNLSCGN